jgi:hypothetical protein
MTAAAAKCPEVAREHPDAAALLRLIGNRCAAQTVHANPARNADHCRFRGTFVPRMHPRTGRRADWSGRIVPTTQMHVCVEKIFCNARGPCAI